MMLKKIAIRTITDILSVIALIACAPKATDEEINRMCDRLLELRGKAGDISMKTTCVTEAKNEEISERQARCRIKAVNAQEYWHRCRTGPPKD